MVRNKKQNFEYFYSLPIEGMGQYNLPNYALTWLCSVLGLVNILGLNPGKSQGFQAFKTTESSNSIFLSIHHHLSVPDSVNNQL